MELDARVAEILHRMYPELENSRALERLKLVDPEEVTKRIKDKDVIRRWNLSLISTAQLLREGPVLVEGDSSEERLDAFQRCAQHAGVLWLSSVALVDAGAHAPAMALALSCAEEVGKLSVERLRLWGIGEIDVSSLESALELPKSLTTRPFYSHRTKHFLAAMSGALINNRVDRILGLPFVNRFLADAEAGILEKRRQACLYMDRLEDGTLHIPIEEISSQETVRQVALSGEILAEVVGFEPALWERFLDLVQEFEINHGLTTAEAEEKAKTQLDERA